MGSAINLLGRIGAIQTLIENFPMSILNKMQGKKYTNVIDFVIDVLRTLGISEQDILNELILLIFNVPNAVELYNKIGSFTYSLIKKPTQEQIDCAIIQVRPDRPNEDDPLYIAEPNGEFDESGNTLYDYYVKKSPIADDIDSEFLVKLEDSLKTIISTILTTLFSCSVNPYIPKKYLDDYESVISNGIELPIEFIDPYGLLLLSPTSYIGRNFYNVDSDLSSTDLYKTADMNAFIWYALNRSSNFPQYEKNKMVWDSRYQASKMEMEERTTAGLWNKWYNSKAEDSDLLYLDGKKQDYENAYESGQTRTLPVYPILQFEKSPFFHDGYQGITVKIPHQTFTRLKKNGQKGASTIYEFNDAYLKNIRILSPKLILCNMLDDILNGNITNSITSNLNIRARVIEAKLNKYIKTALEVDDASISDCFFSFSNEDYDELLKENELRRYGAVEIGSETSPAMKIDPTYGLDAINSINSQATSHEKIETIKKTVYDISSLPSEDDSVKKNTNNGLSIDPKWINDFIMAIIRPIVRALLSPQVMTLFVINFQIMGLINMEDDWENKVEELLLKKLGGIIVSLIRNIRDSIIEFLMNLFYKNITPLIIMFYGVILMEQLDDWITLLDEAIKCLPTFDFSRNRVMGQIDDVTYADITPTQNTPENANKC